MCVPWSSAGAQHKDTSCLTWKHVEDGRLHGSLLPGFDISAPFPAAHPDPGIKALTERLVQQHSFHGATCSGHRKYRQETSARKTPELLLTETHQRKHCPARGDSELRLWDDGHGPAELEMGESGWLPSRNPLGRNNKTSPIDVTHGEA